MGLFIDHYQLPHKLHIKHWPHVSLHRRHSVVQSSVVLKPNLTLIEGLLRVTLHDFSETHCCITGGIQVKREHQSGSAGPSVLRVLLRV